MYFYNFVKGFYSGVSRVRSRFKLKYDKVQQKILRLYLLIRQGLTASI
jgi:hypothetical protein